MVPCALQILKHTPCVFFKPFLLLYYIYELCTAAIIFEDSLTFRTEANQCFSLVTWFALSKPTSPRNGTFKYWIGSFLLKAIIIMQVACHLSSAVTSILNLAYLSRWMYLTTDFGILMVSLSLLIFYFQLISL